MRKICIPKGQRLYLLYTLCDGLALAHRALISHLNSDNSKLMTKDHSTPSTNRLAAESSPYLQQHASNPVEWYPWGEEALELAQRTKRPILLSIGYSACHWCHVMAHESFEDEATAAVMNELFVNIKVDREERPDLDRIYQTAHQILTRRGGGWPLTVFLTPDQIPFAAGTYFPNRPRYNMPGFTEVMRRIASFYHERPEDVAGQNRELLNILAHSNESGSVTTEFGSGALEAVLTALRGSIDSQYGGFGNAPKFPHCSDVELLLHSKTDQPIALHALRAMAAGGLMDQLGGGFFRYSVDERWEIPHFEKMLYDNGPLLALCADAWYVSRDTLMYEAAQHAAAWVLGEMQTAAGGYCATQDADSEGEEGKYYIWTPEEVREVVGSEVFPLLSSHFGLDQPANFEGHWHLRRYISIESLATEHGISDSDCRDTIEQGRISLLQQRGKRIPPGCDDKILTSWNALMVKGMTRAGRLLNCGAWVDSAENALGFIQRELWRDGRLLAVYKDGDARLMAYLDDYAYLIEALLEMLQTRWKSAHLEFATLLADQLLERFEDGTNGGFFFTASDHEALIHRPKPFMDESMPSGNGVAIRGLLRLGHLLNRMDYIEAAERTLKAGSDWLKRFPTAHGSLALALRDWHDGIETIIIRADEAHTALWSDCAIRLHTPTRQFYIIPTDTTELPEVLAAHPASPGGSVSICGGGRCSPPLTSVEDVERALNGKDSKG